MRMVWLAHMEIVRCHRWPRPNHAQVWAKTMGYESSENDEAIYVANLIDESSESGYESYENDENSYVGHLDESGEKSYESYEDDENNYFGPLLDERGEKIYEICVVTKTSTLATSSSTKAAK